MTGMQCGDWNIVVLGAWNRAILTPAWIGQTVLGSPEDAPVEVLVPLDGVAPFQVRHQGITVVPAPGQLLVQLEEPTEALLTRAMEVTKKAISDLPRTPLRACGINIRYSAPEPPALLLDRMRCQSERLFSDNSYEVRMRRRGETLAFHEGTLNVIADIPTTGTFTLTLNFDRPGPSHSDILDWLSRPANDYIDEATKVVAMLVQ
jgi:hypothetical protein